MNSVWKDVLWPGKWSFPDGRVLELTSDKIASVYANGKAMLAAGLDVPFCWEHQPGAQPHPVELSSAVYGDKDKRADWAKNVIAPAVDYRIKSDPARGNVLEAAFDKDRLTVDELNSIEKCGKVSCRLDKNFRDARDGKVYDGFSVSHIAVTPKPLEPNQKPFQMSQSCEESFYFGIAQDDDGDDDDKPVKKQKTDDSAADDAPKGGSTDVAMICEALRGEGWNIPDEVVDADGLVIAIKAGSAPKSDPNDPAGTGQAKTTTAAGAAPLMMSQSEMYAQRPAIVDADRREVCRRIQILVESGRVAPPVAKQLQHEFSSFELSYDGGNYASTGVIAELKAYEKLPEGMVMKPGPGFDMSAVNPPPEFTDKSKKEQADAVAKDVADRAEKYAGKR